MPQSPQNRLLAALPRAGQRAFVADCDHIVLTLDAILAQTGETIRHVHFPTSGFISLIVSLDNGAQLEVEIIGNEGMLGSSIGLGMNTSGQKAIVQGQGTALRMGVAAFRRHCRQNPQLRGKVERYIQASKNQLAQMSACTRYHHVEERLARRLLMGRDRAGTNQLHLTHEFLASMLGVRRVGITQAARTLQARGLIRYTRGAITIVDGAGLRTRSCECYQVANRMYQQAMKSPRRSDNRATG
jgi:CRP-like cAMP-binding protein